MHGALRHDGESIPLFTTSTTLKTKRQLCCRTPKYLRIKVKMDPGEDLWQRGIAQFNRREFFECHESWEAVWLPAPEPDKTFLQGIIQVAAAFHHYLSGNRAGAESLMRRGLAKIARFPADYRGLRLADLRASAQRWHQAIAAGQDLPLHELPRIEPV